MTHYENIPQELQALSQWVCANPDSKVPMRADGYAAASSTNPATWTDFNLALTSVNSGYYDYLGFVFADNGLVGIDIDDGFDEDGFLSVTAADIIGACKSYTEHSKSGRGFHIIVKGSLPFKGKNNLNGVEIYSAARYFIMTGDTLLYDKIIENQAAIDYVVEKYFPAMRESNGTPCANRIYTPCWERPENGRIKTRPVYPEIQQGCRNICLTSLAGMLHTIGYSAAWIYDELVRCNDAACKPPLDTGELRAIVNSITKYERKT